MRELVFATHNEHKALEIQAVLGDSFRVLTLDRAGFPEDLPEEQDTLEGNALQKACYVYERMGRDCFADDTGLEVRVLGDAPGVYSARYAELTGERLPDEAIPDANIRKLLRQMDRLSNRSARFRTVIALFIDGRQYTFEGVVEGSILEKRKGNEGFGYDPVFQPQGYHQTFAEMTLAEKNRISHRAVATKKLAEFLKNYRSGQNKYP
jgi:XTP/dITP diphosphohydrolase